MHFNYQSPSTFLTSLPRYLCVFTLFLFMHIDFNLYCPSPAAIRLILEYGQITRGHILNPDSSSPSSFQMIGTLQQALWFHVPLPLLSWDFNLVYEGSDLTHVLTVTSIHVWKSASVCRKHCFLVVIHCLWPSPYFIIYPDRSLSIAWRGWYWHTTYRWTFFYCLNDVHTWLSLWAVMFARKCFDGNLEMH